MITRDWGEGADVDLDAEARRLTMRVTMVASHRSS